MCGIAGVAAPSGLDACAYQAPLARAIERLRPRGPDARGTWHDACCVLGHTRLKVIDLSPAADQPMAGHGAVICYNGEIYNFAALRAELTGVGARFRTRSDTEVLLAGWRRWGEALLPRLVGMFAFALWDGEARALVLARDRFGKKPLLYAAEGGRIAFASDLVALDCLRGERADIDPAALKLLFTLRYLPEPWSIRPGIAKLPPGHLLRLDSAGTKVTPWYRLARQPLPRYANDAEGLADLRARFDRAVADRLAADVPLGVFLSGGIDSALVAAAATASGNGAQCFTVGYDGVPGYYDERARARAVARHLGCRHDEIVVPAGAALDALDAVFDGLDEPFGDSSAVPTYLLARAARAQVTVALSGDGADEVFGGYRKYRAERLAGLYRALPAGLRRRVIEPLVEALPEAKGRAGLEQLRRLRRFAAHAGKSGAARQAGLNRLLGEAELDALLCAPAPAPGLEAMVEALRAEAGCGDPVNTMLAADIALGLPGDMLVKVDRMSMANGLEVRCPFLDHRVVECAMALPGRLKVGVAAGKIALRRAFADRLPRTAWNAPKRGFELPIAEWLLGPLAKRLARAIEPARLRRQGLFRPELPARWLDELRARRRDTSEMLWTLLAFQEWHQRRGGA